MATTVGQLSEIRGEVVVEWRLTDFFSLSEKVDEWYISPAFDFLGASWLLQLYPNGQTKFNTPGWIGMYVLRGNSGPPVSLTFTCLLKAAEGKKKEDFSHTAVFDQKDKGWGFMRFQLRSDLLKRKSELAPSDVLTIKCCLKNVDPNVVARTEKLSQDLKQLMLSKDDSDVTVRVKGEEFSLHRIVLGARIPVFSSMFKHEMREKTTGIVSIDDCEADTFRDFINYVYTGRVDKLSPENVFGLYEVADKYQVDELKADCLGCMKNILSVDTFFDVIGLALRHDEKVLLKLATDFFCDKMKDIIVTADWPKFMHENTTQANELLLKALVNKGEDK